MAPAIMELVDTEKSGIQALIKHLQAELAPSDATKNN
jgi:hypothetical protein